MTFFPFPLPHLPTSLHLCPFNPLSPSYSGRIVHGPLQANCSTQDLDPIPLTCSRTLLLIWSPSSPLRRPFPLLHHFHQHTKVLSLKMQISKVSSRFPSPSSLCSLIGKVPSKACLRLLSYHLPHISHSLFHPLQYHSLATCFPGPHLGHTSVVPPPRGDHDHLEFIPSPDFSQGA